MTNQIIHTVLSPGDTLKKVITEQGLTRKAFALKIGRSESFIKLLVNGSVRITPKTAVLLEGATGLSVEFWMALEKTYLTQRALPEMNGYEAPAATCQTPLEQRNKRLSSLDEATQEHIAQKYYGGRRPWAGVR